MGFRCLLYILLVCGQLFFFQSHAANGNKDIPEFPVKVQAQSFEQSGETYLLVKLQNAKHWHTYWKNPGDAGQAPQFKFTLDGKDLALEPLEWMAPKKFLEQGNIQAFGYDDLSGYIFKIPHQTLEQMQGKILAIKAKWLVCKHICIPGSAELKGQFQADNFKKSFPEDFKENTSAETFIEKIPSIKSDKEIEHIQLFLTDGKEPNTLTLHYHFIGGPWQNLTGANNLIFPFPQDPFGWKRETLYSDGKDVYGKFDIEWDGEYMEPEMPLPSDGRFAKPVTLKFILNDILQNKHILLEKTFDSFEVGRQSDYEKLYSSLNPINEMKPIKEKSSASESFLTYLVLAFLGGLILNFMPCVLPVISLKLFGLIKHKNASRGEVLKHNIAYTLGVCFAFMILAAIVALLKNAGTEIGWGFQLQSPSFVGVMVIGLVVFALNLFGLFEFKMPFSNKLGGVETGEGFSGDFLSGILATILSTPCSAPLLGTALTFAFTTTTLNIFIMLLFVGLGLSSPFLLTAIFPRTIAFLPNPGNWMIVFKKFLGVTLLATAAWLGSIFYTLQFSTTSNAEKIAAKAQKLNLNWRPWSEEKMKSFPGELVFVDFTADWCFTCKVNESLVLNTEGFSKLVEKYRVNLLLADWTKRDEVIGKFLKTQGLVGVPAYFVVKKDGTLHNLGETISLKEIEAAFQ